MTAAVIQLYQAAPLLDRDRRVDNWWRRRTAIPLDASGLDNNRTRFARRARCRPVNGFCSPRAKQRGRVGTGRTWPYNVRGPVNQRGVKAERNALAVAHANDGIA